VKRSSGERTLWPSPRAADSEGRLQPMHEPPPRVVAEPSRRRPPRQRSPDPIPIPETRARARPQPVRLQDVLAAHQRAVEARIDEGLREIREAAAAAVRQVAAEVAESARAPQGPDQADLARGFLTYADERFQAMRLRLERIEEALRRLALAQRRPEAAAGDKQTEAMAREIRDLARQQRDVFARLARAHQRALAGLAASHRTALDDLARRTGRGVVAVGRKLQEDIEDVRTSVRSIHRTIAWEGMARGSRSEEPVAEDR